MRENRWLHDWIDEFDVVDTPTAIGALKTRSGWDRLLELAAGHARETEVANLGRRGIVAGRAMDLTGFLACGHPECLTKQVDELFARVWHYFDKIAVVGADAHLVEELVAEGRSDRVRQTIVGHVQVILHTRATGAERFLVFVEKPPACYVHWPDYRNREDLHIPDDVMSNLATDMLRTGSISLEKSRNGDLLAYRGRGIWSGQHAEKISRLDDYRREGHSLEEALIVSILQQHALGAASDLHAANQLGLPLGSGIELETKLLTAIRPTTTEEQIAFHLKLPVVDDLSISELLELRETEHDAFEAFRLSLRHAMRERLSEDGNGDPARLAADIEEEVLEPAIIDLQQRLSTAQRNLNRKRIVHGGLLGLSTVCGLLGEAPAAAAFGMAAIGSGVPGELKGIDSKGEIESSDMYFLWHVKHANDRKANVRSKRTKKRAKRNR